MINLTNAQILKFQEALHLVQLYYTLGYLAYTVKSGLA